MQALGVTAQEKLMEKSFLTGVDSSNLKKAEAGISAAAAAEPSIAIV